MQGTSLVSQSLPPLPWARSAAARKAYADRGPFLLVTTAHPSLHEHTFEGAIHPNLGRLIQPRHTSSIEATATSGIPWAADNDCFQGLDPVKYVAMIDRIAPLAASCLYVTVPDVVGDALATAHEFEKWAPAVTRRGLPAALVAQDGLEDMTAWLDRTWHRIDALFMGGSTEWKEGEQARELAREAKRRGKWVHWGRVNTKRRFDLLVEGGAIDSFDGSKFARFRKTYLDGGLEWARVEAERREWARRRELDDEVYATELELTA